MVMIPLDINLPKPTKIASGRPERTSIENLDLVFTVYPDANNNGKYWVGAGLYKKCDYSLDFINPFKAFASCAFGPYDTKEEADAKHDEFTFSKVAIKVDSEGKMILDLIE